MQISLLRSSVNHHFFHYTYIISLVESALLIILVDLTMTCYCEKLMISTKYVVSWPTHTKYIKRSLTTVYRV